MTVGLTGSGSIVATVEVWPLRAAGHHPVVRGQTRIADRLESGRWRRRRRLAGPSADQPCPGRANGAGA